MTGAGPASAAMRQKLPGLDLGRLEEHLRLHLAEPPSKPLRAELFAGGKSNLTYRVTDGDHEWVVRRAPLGHVLATAHDVAREHRVMTALADSEVPVPRTFLLCTDAEVLGASFCVMERVAGTAYRTAAQLELLGPERTRSVVLTLIDQLVALHRVDPASVGLADFGRPAGFLDRQLTRWARQIEASRTTARPGLAELQEGLAQQCPGDVSQAIVHGDYRLDNVLFGDDDRVTAVLDWEMSTVGDPLTDLALLLSRNHDPEAAEDARMFDATSAPGFPSSAEMADRYAAATGRDLSHLGWYVALAQYKRAAILEGIHFRHVSGLAVGPDLDGIEAMIEPTIRAGLRALSGPSR